MIQNFALFLTLSWILIITPGPDILYVLTRGISQGKKAALISALGITLGIMVHTLFAALGLSVILKTSAVAFSAVKLAGAAYLVYLGIKSFTSKSTIRLAHRPPAEMKKIFMQGFITNTLNPKVAIFFMAFLPQFIVATGTEVITPVPFIILGVTFALNGLIFLLALGYFSGLAGTFLSRKNSITTWTERVSGSILILLGVRLAFLKQQS